MKKLDVKLIGGLEYRLLVLDSVIKYQKLAKPDKLCNQLAYNKRYINGLQIGNICNNKTASN